MSPEASSWLWRFLRLFFLFFFFMTLTILKSSGRVFCTMSLDWDLSDGFLIVGPGNVFGAGGRRGEVAASSLLSRADTGNIPYWCAGELWSLSGSLYKATLFPLFPCCVLWINVTMHNPQARSGSYFPSLRVEYLHTYLEFLGVLSLLFIYLYLYGLMDIYFILWGIIQYNFILFFLLKLFHLCSLGSCSAGSPHFFTRVKQTEIDFSQWFQIPPIPPFSCLHNVTLL